MPSARFARFTALAALAAAASACRSGPTPEPESRRDAPKPKATATATATAAQRAVPASPPPTAKKISAKPVAEVPVTPGDPAGGKFTLEEATKGLPAGTRLTAKLKTDKGSLDCELWPDKAPITVANFVGLARGLRPWRNPEGAWVKKPLYDGTPFHRIIKGFMIQGGDPKGNGSGDPGFVIPDEVWEGARHDQRGLLCMANRGPNTNGSQFFVMDGAASHLDGGYTIFGKCGPDVVIEALAGVETRGDRPIEAPKITQVTIQRTKG